MSDTSVVFSILATEKVSETLGRIPGAAAISGAAIGLALMGGINKAMDQQSATNMLAAQLGAGTEMAASLGKISGDLYANNFGDSIQDIDDALKGVWQNGLVAEDAADADIQAVTAKVINSAKLMGSSYDEVSRSVSQMLRTGLAKSADEAFDVLTRGMQQGVNKSEDLLETFNEYGTQFRKIGLDGTTAMGLLSQAIGAGARDADIAADALKEFSIRAIDGSTLSAQGFKDLGLSGKKMAADIGAGGDRAAGALDITMDRLRAIKDPVKQAQIATALFGTQAEDLGKALFAMDPSSAVAAMGKVAGAADKAGQTLGGGAAAQLETFKRQLEQGFVTVVGGKVIPILNTFGTTVAKVGGWFKTNWDWVAPIAVVLGTFAGSIALIVGVMNVWKTVTTAYTAVQWALNAAMMANPIGLIILALIALAAGITYLWFHSAAFRDFLIGMWSAIWGFLKGVGHWFAHDFLDFFSGVYHWLQDKAVAYHNFMTSKWNALVGFVTSIPSRIRSAATGMWDGVKDAFRSAINWIISKWNGLHLRIPPINVPGIGQLWGGMDLRVPQLPMLAAGGVVTRGGLAGINEAGAEVVSLPTGAAVYPHGSVPAGGGRMVEARFAGNTDSALARLLHQLQADGILQFVMID